MEQLRNSLIDGVIVEPLKEITDERGAVLHIMRNDSPLFSGFGEVYCSLTLPRAVKAWKRHRRQVQHFAVPIGVLRVVLFDSRPDSPTKDLLEQHILGRPTHYNLLRIPAGIWYGFQVRGDQQALIVNLVNIPHDPEESERLPLLEGPIKFNWEKD